MANTQWEIRRAVVGQNKIKIILCDDDPVFLNVLQEELIRTFVKLNMRAEITALGGPGAIRPEQLASCDMAFLDIDFESEDFNGIDIARGLRQVNRHALVFFVTNYIDYAPAGYEVQAFRYILKRDLDEVLERYILQAMDDLAEGQKYLRLRDQEMAVDVPLEQIRYLEVVDHYVSIYAEGNTYTLTASLTNLEKEMEKHGFLRIHKSYLVNMVHIRRFRSRECVLTDGTALAVSEKNYSQQKRKYLLWKGM